ncbi:hypothetical protein Q9233_010644 [Columba guinea]|nr:hypothetical protein Q9233_010644 [Columba guinea]
MGDGVITPQLMEQGGTHQAPPRCWSLSQLTRSLEEHQHQQGLKRPKLLPSTRSRSRSSDGAVFMGLLHYVTFTSHSEIKNKQRWHFVSHRWKQRQRKEKLANKRKRRKDREALGDKAPPKTIPKTMENQRVYNETTVDPNDEEVAFDEAADEFAPYFNRQTVPKILITTSDRPRRRTVRFCEQLLYLTHMSAMEEDWL